MIKHDDRLEELSKFNKIGILSTMSRDESVQLIVYLEPTTSLVIIERSDGADLPKLALSYSLLTNDFEGFEVNDKNRMDEDVSLVIEAWKELSEDDKMGVFNSVPIGASYLSRR